MVDLTSRKGRMQPKSLLKKGNCNKADITIAFEYRPQIRDDTLDLKLFRIRQPKLSVQTFVLGSNMLQKCKSYPATLTGDIS